MGTERGLLLILLSGLVLGLWAYLPGLEGPFLFDDYPNIVDNNRITEIDDQRTGEDLFLASFSSQAGPLKRPVSMLSFGLSYHWSGMVAAPFKLFNLAVHLLCGLSIFFLCRLLLKGWAASAPHTPFAAQANWLAAWAALVWTLHPMQLSSVLYVVQRMTELATLFTLLGLIAYADGRLRGDSRGLLQAAGGLAVFGLLAALSKESGVLILAYALVLELTCFHFRGSRLWQTRAIVGFYLLAVILPAIAGLAFLVLNPDLVERHYRPRDFTLVERLLTQTRILWQYLGEIALPLPSRLGLYHDEIPLSTSWLQPLQTLPALLGLVGVTAWALWKRARYPIAAFAVLWFLAGHAMESTVIPLELKFEHRNYLSMLGPLLLLVVVIQRLAEPLRAWAPVATLALLTVAITLLTHQRSMTWSDEVSFALAEAHNNPHSTRANYQAGLALVKDAQGDPQDLKSGLIASREYFQKAADARPDYALGVTGLILSHFGEPSIPDHLVTELARRLRVMRNPDPDAIKDIVNGQMNGKLALTSEQVLGLLEALLENPLAAPLAKATVLNKMGEYYFNKLQDPQTAVSLTLAAAEQAPGHALFRINVANLALILERPDVAAQAVGIAKELDRIGLWSPEIEKIEQEIRLKAAVSPTGDLDESTDERP